VKLGTIRPATTEISAITAARPRRHPSPVGQAAPTVSRCISKLAKARTTTAPIIGRLRQLLPATTSRATTPTSINGNDKSAEIASQGGKSAEIMQETRPNNHNPARSASGAPFNGRCPVQFGIAVSRKPAIAAITKPNSISWTCQVSGSNRVGIVLPVANMTIHSNSANADHNPAARKKGRKP
jgi:hypothetical protein